MITATFFTFVALLCAAFVSATPTIAPRTCGKGEFLWNQKGCCLKHGGPPKVENPPSGKDCPKTWYWHPGQKCCAPKLPPPTNNPKPECGSSTFPLWNFKNFCCEKPTPSQPSRPQVSPNVGAVQNGNKKFDWEDIKEAYKDFMKNYKKGGHRRSEGYSSSSARSAHARRARASRSLCARGFEACPISGLASEFECVDPVSDVRACGGCPALGAGQDCTTIAFAVDVGCSPQRTCVVTSCESGYRPSKDGKSCESPLF